MSSAFSDLESYRRDAEEYLVERERIEYRHHAGHSPDLPLAGLFERFDRLFDEEAAQDALAAAEGARPGDESRSRRALATFAAEGLMARATRREEEELALREAQATIRFEGTVVGYREAAGLLANEPDAERRAVIDARRVAVVDGELTPILAEGWSIRHRVAVDVGAPSYRSLYEKLWGIDLAGLAAQGEDLLKATEDLYAAAIDGALRREAGVGLGAARRGDLARVRRAASADRHFGAQQMLPALHATLAGLGIDLRRQENVILDTDPRPGKDPRAFCAPVRVPDEVYLVMAPIGGHDDFRALFHEAGHAEHFGGTSRALPVEHRRLGDDAVTETFAFLLEGLLDDPVWLERVMGLRDSRDHLLGSATQRLLHHRRHAAKLSYELALHAGGGLEAMPGLYGDLLTQAVLVPWPRELFLQDVDPGFYVASYLRAWALEVSLRGRLRERFGSRWFESKRAGSFLRELWNEGQRWDADELARELDLPPIDLSVLVEDVGAVLG